MKKKYYLCINKTKMSCINYKKYLYLENHKSRDNRDLITHFHDCNECRVFTFKFLEDRMDKKKQEIKEKIKHLYECKECKNDFETFISSLDRKTEEKHILSSLMKKIDKMLSGNKQRFQTCPKSTHDLPKDYVKKITHLISCRNVCLEKLKYEVSEWKKQLHPSEETKIDIELLSFLTGVDRRGTRKEKKEKGKMKKK